MSYLTDYEDIDGGYFAFGGNLKGGKITAERRNKTLIEVARTMLVDSKLLTTFWVEEVNTACDDGKKVDEDTRQESECKDQEKQDNVNNINNDNVNNIELMMLNIFAQIFSKNVGNKMHMAFPLLVIEFPLPEAVSNASEESSLCQKKREATAVKIALLLKSRRNCQSKSDDSYTKLVPHVMPCILGITIIVTSCTRTPSPLKGFL
nr:putative ribonuclease H-like domain-containing protein [Tanacetum cinerariifolium]